MNAIDAPLQGSNLGWAVRDSLAVAERNLLSMLRVPQLLVFTLVQPVLFTLMFRYVFGGAIQIPGVRYVDYLMPGIFTQTVCFGAISTAIGLADDKGKGLLERMRSLPMSRAAVLNGRVLADGLRNVVVVGLIVAIGFAVGFRSHGGVGKFLLGVLVLVAFGVSLCWLFAFIGLSVTNAEAAQAASFPLMAPLAFASNLFASPDTMPSWLQGWAKHQPVSATADAVRACMLGNPATNKVLVALAWAAGLSIVFGAMAVRRFRRG